MMATCQILTSLIIEIKSDEGGDETVIGAHRENAFSKATSAIYHRPDIIGHELDGVAEVIRGEDAARLNTDAVSVRISMALADVASADGSMNGATIVEGSAGRSRSADNDNEAAGVRSGSIDKETSVVGLSLASHAREAGSLTSTDEDLVRQQFIEELEEAYDNWNVDGDLLDFPDDISGDEPESTAPSTLFDRGKSRMDQCLICYDDTTVFERLCCRFSVCDSCVDTYVKTNVEIAKIVMPCINSKCTALMYSNEVLARLPLDLKEKYYRFLVDANKNPGEKTCPRCSHIRVLPPPSLAQLASKKGLLVKCFMCQLEWCFICQAPWHRGMTCKTFRKGNKHLKSWSKQFHQGQQNAQRCPKCKVYIQRNEGCDTMTCSQCNTEFCYQCGGRFRKVFLVGGHDNSISVLGCSKSLFPRSPFKRRLVRGSLCAASIALGVAFAPVVAVAAVPLGIIKASKVIRKRRQRSRNRQYELLMERWQYILRSREDTRRDAIANIALTREEFMLNMIQLMNGHENMLDGLGLDTMLLNDAISGIGDIGDASVDAERPSLDSGDVSRDDDDDGDAVLEPRCRGDAAGTSEQSASYASAETTGDGESDGDVVMVNKKVHGEDLFISRRPLTGGDCARDVVVTTEPLGDGDARDGTVVVEVTSL